MTLIVLLILAGVSIGAIVGNQGIFKKAEQATEIYNREKAREKLELTLSDAQVIKYTEGLTDEQLTNKINEVGEELEERETPDISQAIVEGYIFSIDRTVPKILDYIGPADGVIITSSINGLSNGWMKPSEVANITVIGRIKTYSGGTITNVSATKGGIAIIGFSIDEEGRYTIDKITADTTIVITATDSNGKSNTKIVPITIRIDGVSPILSEIDTTGTIGLTIKFKTTATDNQSGLKERTPLHYTITPTIGLTKSAGDFNPGETVEITATEANEEYTITITAEDKAENQSTPQSKKIKTGIIKHIKTTEGLKTINACDIYGSDIIGYNCTRTGVEWQLFYIDEEDDHRVYLIAKDYMTPPTTNTTPALIVGGNANYPNAYRFGTSSADTSILGSFTGALPAKNTTTALGKFMGKFLSDYARESASSQRNLQATNFMLAQSWWSEYLNTNKAELAFGGPTLPLFQASYNDTCRSATKLGIQKSGTGYQVNLGGGSWSNGLSGYGDTSTQNGIYFKGNTSDSASSMWLASPSSHTAMSMVSATYNRRVWT